MSDIHMELYDNSRYIKANEFDVVGDVLVLAGDMFYLRDIIAPQKKFWNWASENFRQVLLVPGNHEFYSDGDITARGDSWHWMIRENVGYYYNKVVRIDDTDFILTTLWSRIPAQDMFHVHRGMNERDLLPLNEALPRNRGCMWIFCRQGAPYLQRLSERHK